MSLFARSPRRSGGNKNVSGKSKSLANQALLTQMQRPPLSVPANSLGSDLQRTLGNRAVGRLIRSGAFQAKLNIGPVNDRYEQEADRIADRVVSIPDTMPESKSAPESPAAGFRQISRAPFAAVNSLAASVTPLPLQRKKKNKPPAVAGNIESSIQAAQGAGKPLSARERSFYEPRFGADFSAVKVHTDARAQTLARSVNARAFTVGNNIFFGDAQYSPNTSEGKRLMAHELTHTVQQGGRTMQAAQLQRTCALNRVRPGNRRQRNLTAAQINASISYTYEHYSASSIRIIQRLIGTTVDGDFGPGSARTLGRWQSSHGLTMDGQFGLGSINRAMRTMWNGNCQNYSIQLVADWNNNLGPDTDIRYNPALPGRAPTRSSLATGNLKIVEIGRRGLNATTNAWQLRERIQNAINQMPANRGRQGALPQMTGAVYARVNTRQERRRAVQYNKSRITGDIAVRIIQGLVGANPDGDLGDFTIRYLAQYQHNHSLTVDGKIGPGTMSSFIQTLAANGEHNTAIRLTMDYWRINPSLHFISTTYNPVLQTAYNVDRNAESVSEAQFGPAAFANRFTSLSNAVRASVNETFSGSGDIEENANILAPLADMSTLQVRYYGAESQCLTHNARGGWPNALNHSGGSCGGYSRAADIYAPIGTPIRSPISGTIVDCGLRVRNRRYDVTIFHSASRFFSRGQRVTQGRIIGTVGDGGNACAERPHLHMHIRDRINNSFIPYTDMFSHPTKKRFYSSRARKMIITDLSL